MPDSYDESMTIARLHDTVAIRILRTPGRGALDERAIALANLNDVHDQLGLRLAPGSRDPNGGEDGYEGKSGISHIPPPPATGYDSGRLG